jgi:hypothetical protein
MVPRSLLTGSLLLTVALTAPAPALAMTADPARSSVMIQAPELAPGANGSAPLYGEWNGGSFVVHAPVSALRTGNAFHDSIIKQVVKGTVTLQGANLRPIRKIGNITRLTGMGTLYVAGSTNHVPVIVRTIQQREGVYMQTYCQVPLAPYGVRTMQGGNPGSVRVAINAFFPGK